MKRIKKHNKLIRTAIKNLRKELIPWMVISYFISLAAVVISMI